jgi:hypothetical protein
MTTKYRIISEPSELYPDQIWYQAQYKVFNLFWTNCIYQIGRPGLNRSLELENVEKYIDALIHNKWKDCSTKVVRVYE